jgi:hypothetical protein
MARGKWIAFLDGDDEWLPWRLEAQFHVIGQHPEAVLVCGEVAIMGREEEISHRVHRDHREVGLEEFVDENPVPTSTVLARRETILKVGGFDERFRGPEDIDLWMRMAAEGPVWKIRRPLARYREQPGSLSMDPDRFLPNIVAVYEKAFGPDGALAAYRALKRRALAGRYVSAAWSHQVCGRRAQAALLILRSWLLWPGRLKVEEKRPTWRFLILARVLLHRV